MSNFGRALAGAVAGGARATEEVFDARIQSTEDQRKEAVLQKRQMALQKFSQDFTLDRDAKRDVRADEVTADNRAYKEEDDPSGKTLDGVPLTKRQLSRLSDKDLGRTRTVQATADDERGKDEYFQTELAKTKIQGQIDVAKEYGKNKNKSNNKEKSITAIKFAKENAINSLAADLGVFGGEYSETVKGFEIPKDKKMTPEMVKELFAKVKSVGFSPTISEDDKYITIRLGGFNYDQMQPGLAVPTGEVVTADDRSKIVFDELYGALNKNKKPLAAPGSNLNTLKSSHSNSLAAPIETTSEPKVETPAEVNKLIQQYEQATGQSASGKTAEEIARVIKGLSDIDYSQVKATPNYLKGQ